MKTASIDDFRPERITEILSVPGWAIISAHVARDPLVSPGVWNAVNQDRTCHLFEFLRRNYGPEKVWAVTGSYGGVEERSALVLGVDARTAAEIGREYDQEAVLVPNGLVYCDASGAHRFGGVLDAAVRVDRIFTSRPTQDYTRIHATQAVFSVVLASQVGSQREAA